MNKILYHICMATFTLLIATLMGVALFLIIFLVISDLALLIKAIAIPLIAILTLALLAYMIEEKFEKIDGYFRKKCNVTTNKEYKLPGKRD